MISEQKVFRIQVVPTQPPIPLYRDKKSDW